jgi:polysaccharide biosynthesis protein PslG
LKLLFALNLAAVSAIAAVHWDFESDAFALDARPGFYGRGGMPEFAAAVAAPEIWDGGSLTNLGENRRSLYFKPTAVGGLAPAGGELAVDGALKELHLPTLTVEAFVRVEGPQRMFGLIASKRRAGNGCTWSLSVTLEGVFSVRLDTQPGAAGDGFNRTVSSGVAVNDGGWHHVAMVFDNETRQCAVYVDYQRMRSETIGSALVYDDAELTIGRGLNGWLDDIRITPAALHPEQFLRPTQFFTDCIPAKVRAYPDVMLDLTPTRVQTGVSLQWEEVGTLKPKSVDEIPGDFWSLGCETLDRDLADWDAYKGYLKPLGIKRIRLQGGWNKSEKKRGEYDFAWLDHIVDSAHELGLAVCMETSYGNRLYDPKAGLGPGGLLPSGAEELKAWDAWVEAMVRHYRPKGVREWMMYNEPNLRKDNTVEKIVDFNARTAAIIRRVDPEARIGGLVCSGLNIGLIENWIKGMQAKGALENFTWIIYHGYAGNPDALNEGMRRAKAMVRGYSPALKLWQGEAGCASEPVQYALSGVDWTELSHAKWNARRMLCDFGGEIESTVFTISDLSYHKDFISRYGLLKTNPDNSLIKVKTAYYVVNNIVSVFNDSVGVNPECRFEVEAPHKITKFAFKDKQSGADLITFWDGGALPVNDCKTGSATVTVKDLRAGRLVWVDLLTGRIFEVPSTCIAQEGGVTTVKDVPYLDSPVLLTDLAVLSYVEARKSSKRAAVKKPAKVAAAAAAVPMRSYRLFGSQKPAPAVIICATDLPETWAEALAEWLRALEIHAFVLEDSTHARSDAVAYVRSMAHQWSVDPSQIGLLGVSARVKDFAAEKASFAVMLNGGKTAATEVNMLSVAKPAGEFDASEAWLGKLADFLEPRRTEVF